MLEYDPYYDWKVEAGRSNLHRLLLAEIRTMADHSRHCMNSGYKKFRRQALDYYEMNYTTDRFRYDAWIPCVAISLVDRYHLDGGEIPIIVHPRWGQNKYMFLICCLMIAMKLRNQRFEVHEVLRTLHYPHFSDESVREMQTHIYRKLQWDFPTVTPFCFVQFLFPFINILPNPSGALYTVYELIVKSYYDIGYTSFTPSVLAVSAYLVVAKELAGDTIGIQTEILQSNLFMEKMIFRCSYKLNKLYKLPPCIIPAGDWPTPTSNHDSDDYVAAAAELLPPQQRGVEIQAKLGWIEAETRTKAEADIGCCSCNIQ